MVDIKKTHFTGLSKVFDKGDEGLSALIRGLAQSVARTHIDTNLDLTDSSTGSADTDGIIEAQSSPLTAFTKAGTDCAPKAGFDTAVGKIANAMAVLAEHVNTINTDLSLPAITDSTGGTVGTSGTVPALDKTLTAVNSNCVDATTANATLAVIKTNMATLYGVVDRIAVAVGTSKLSSSLGELYSGGVTLEAISSTGTSVDGTADSTLADATVDAELTAIANNIATLSWKLDQITSTTVSELAPEVVAFDI